MKKNVLEMIYVAGNCLNDTSFIKDINFFTNIFNSRFILHTENGVLSSCIQARILYLIMVKYTSPYEILTIDNVLVSKPFKAAKTNLFKHVVL